MQILFYSEREVKNLFIIPLVLLTLVENVFKHGNLAHQSNPAFVTVKADQKNLVIQTRNLMSPYLKESRSRESGLNNIKQRLSFAYGDQAIFSFNTADGFFEVYLSIPLDFLTTQPPSLSTSIGTDKVLPHESAGLTKTND